jgi:hypothetical protein
MPVLLLSSLDLNMRLFFPSFFLLVVYDSGYGKCVKDITRKWYEELKSCAGVVVMFGDTYRSNYNKSLKIEAEAILHRYRKGKLEVHVFDPLKDKISVLTDSLNHNGKSDSTMAKNFKSFKSFVKSADVVEDDPSEESDASAGSDGDDETRVHWTFSGAESGALTAQVVSFVQKAGCEFTGTHVAQDDNVKREQQQCYTYIYI